MLARSDWLTLCEVEVYQRQVCYEGVRYATEACAECTGPGPNQCTRCNDDAALVPFRAANHASATYRSAGFEGSCSKYTRDIQALDLPGAATTAASLLPSISTKWVEVSTSALLPAKSSTGMDAVDVHVNCLMYKVVWCAARTALHRCSIATAMGKMCGGQGREQCGVQHYIALHCIAVL